MQEDKTDEITEVPLLDLDAQFATIEDEIKEAVDAVFDHQQYIMGPEVSQLEGKLARYCGVDHAIGCASGSDALLLSLMALDVEPGDYVITTPFTFFATAGAIARLGAVPVFLDIDPVSYNIDPEQIQKFLQGNHPLNNRFPDWEQKTKAIIPVHLYGQMADMDPIMQLADEFDIAVVEDAAQAIGARYQDKFAGAVGDTGCFSFFPSKNLGGFGDGGFITTNNDELADKMRTLRVHGAKPKYHHHLVGINSRLDTIQAAALMVKLNYIDDWNARRREAANRYRKLFRNKGVVIDQTSDLKTFDWESFQFHGKLLPPQETTGDPEEGGRHVYHQFVIRTAKRDQLREVLKEANIGHSIYYPVSLHEQECFAEYNYQPEDCPHAVCASNQTLALPVYPELTEPHQYYIVDTIHDFLSSP